VDIVKVRFPSRKVEQVREKEEGKGKFTSRLDKDTAIR